MFLLLPLEKLPTWLLGPFLAISGAFMALTGQPGWRQIEGGAFIVIGVALTIFGVRKLNRQMGEKAADAAPSGKSGPRHNGVFVPDFSKHTEEELRQILTRLNQERYPDRAAEVKQRLANFANRPR